MVRRTNKSRARPKGMGMTRAQYATRRRKARGNRKTASLRIGGKKFAVKVTCRGKVRFTRAGRKSFNAQKRSLKTKCRVGKRRRTIRSRRNVKGGDQRITWL